VRPSRHAAEVLPPAATPGRLVSGAGNWTPDAPVRLLPLLLARLRIDLLAALATLVLSSALLGMVVWWFAGLHITLDASPAKLDRWTQASLPVATMLVFLLTFKRFTPWFSGILASVILWVLPGVSLLVRLPVFVVLCVLLGLLDVYARRQARKRA